MFMRVNKIDYHFSKLRYQPDFEHFTDEEFEEIKEQTVLRSYKKGQVLFDEGDERQRFYVLTEGLIRLERYDESATYYYYDYVTANNLFPMSGIFEEEPYTYTAQAMTDIETFYFPVACYEKIVKNNPNQLIYMIQKLGKVVQMHELRIQIGLTSSAFDRVKQNLFVLKEELGIPTEDGHISIPYPITLKELAVNSGTTRETAGQVIKQLKDSGLVNYDKKRFTFCKEAVTPGWRE
ncbi:Transcriptional regulator ArcR [Enterococcus mundtii 1A]|uniref:Arginine deiminase pathway transcriptional regulator, Crp family protein n=2 Tax=Enterococcus mundtii TaxID=53346 RepID=A0AAI8W9U3_ENTMU|nr:Transcriptional regulator ArcR [Enterococcus mundtii 1A]OJG57480.1 cyclic nucleotide-binding protein [Enterococcus mundtii]BBM13596.1 arginine deiminase pathway transcriptional regulator, Crp family protein [Enterococcus mundtii]GEL81523.1 cyclic nucleotide-binding protein [Enterococcus mundtii]GKS56191.1 ArcR family transcriptional regulator [Enterococcus mundtii]